MKLKQGPARPPGVLVIDDHPIVRAGIRNHLEAHSHFRVVAEAGTVTQARTLLRKPLVKSLGYLVVDVQLDQGTGLDIIHEAQLLDPPLEVVVVTAFPSVQVVRHAVGGGARAVVLKEAGSSALVLALCCVEKGQVFLDPHLGDIIVDALLSPPVSQRDVYNEHLLALLADGLTDKEIARRVGKTASGVTHDIAALLKRMGVSSRAAAVNEAIRRGILGSLTWGEG
jgi:two-component system response regulator DevR